jgi:hypothetical protein
LSSFQTLHEFDAADAITRGIKICFFLGIVKSAYSISVYINPSFEKLWLDAVIGR